jgi:aminoglycoside phosphotransferase (APT) family kinase protein
MPDNDFLGRSLAALQNTVADDLRDDLRSSRKREYAACAARVIARLRTDIESAPALAAERLAAWRALSGAAAREGGNPLHELQAHAAAIGQKLDAQAADLSTPGSDAAVWFAQAVKATRDYLDTYEAALPKSAGKQEAAADLSGVQQEKLSRYLKARFPGLPENPVRSLRIVPGGRAKETSIFELAPNDLLPIHLVMRRDLSQSVTGTNAYAEFPLLQKMESLGLPVPSPILAEKDPSHLGGSFIIVTEIKGAAGGELFAELNDLTKLDPSFGPDFARALAKLHSLREHPSGAELGGHGMGANPAEMLQGFHAMFKGIATKPPLHLASELGFAWLLANPLPADRPRRLVHGDAGLHNILVRDGKLAAILDWELTHLGDPAEDIAFAWSPLLRHLMTWDDFKKIYIENGGDPAACDKAAVAWYSVWAHTRNSVYVGMFYGWAAEGTRADIESFNAALDFFGRTQQYIARELDEALK